jgi:trans-aconitate methyltransferase
MQRICEPELMDRVAQAQAYGAADFSASDQAVVERLVELLGPGALGEPLRILDLGCGPGNITFRVAERFPHAQLIGLDGAVAMLDLAQQTLSARPDWRQRVSFVGERLPLGPGSVLTPGFGALVSNSLLHHLHDPQVLWRTVRALAAPGAVVLIRDLRRPEHPEQIGELVARHARGAPALLQQDYAHSLGAAFTLAEVTDQLHQAGLAQLQARELDDRYLEVAGWLA